MTPHINYYQILGLEQRATDRQIRAAFRRAVLEHHPDRHNNAVHAQETTILLKQAYDVLSDPSRRLEHDYTLRRCHQTQPPARRQAVKPPAPSRRPRPFNALVLPVWGIVELGLFTADRVLPRFGSPNWLLDSFTGSSLTPTVAILEGDTAFITHTLAAAVGFLSFLLARACFRLVGRSSRS